MAAGAQILAWLRRAAGCRAGLPLAVAGRRAPAARQTPGPRRTGVDEGGAADDASPEGPGARARQPVAAPEGTLVPLGRVAARLLSAGSARRRATSAGVRSTTGTSGGGRDLPAAEPVPAIPQPAGQRCDTRRGQPTYGW